MEWFRNFSGDNMTKENIPALARSLKGESGHKEISVNAQSF